MIFVYFALNNSLPPKLSPFTSFSVRECIDLSNSVCRLGKVSGVTLPLIFILKNSHNFSSLSFLTWRFILDALVFEDLLYFHLYFPRIKPGCGHC